MAEHYYIKLVFKNEAQVFLARSPTKSGYAYIFRAEKDEASRFKTKDDCDFAIKEVFDLKPSLKVDLDHTEVIIW